VTDLKAPLSELLTTAVRGRGAASVSVIAPAGAEPQVFWLPEGGDEPAFLAYSITKTFTAVLVLKLCEEGRLSLDDPLARWFPAIDRAERIPLRRLLNHTAGIPDYGGLRAYHDSLRATSSIPWSFERFAAETFDKGAPVRTRAESHLRWGKPSYGLGLMGDPASPWGRVLGHNGGGPCTAPAHFTPSTSVAPLFVPWRPLKMTSLPSRWFAGSLTG
jgi:hypothetical protein